MRTVRLCAIIVIGVALGYAFDETTSTNSDNGPADSVQSVVSSLLGR